MAEITVIIPSYNMPDGVVGAIDSALGQQVSLNVVVIDDCSEPPLHLPDRLLEDKRVKLIRQTENKGVSAARNFGVDNSQTPWLTFLDSDDVLLPDTLHLRLKFAKDALHEVAGYSGRPRSDVYSNALICCGWIDPSHDQKSLKIRVPKSADNAAQFASGCWYHPGSCAIYHHSVFELPGRKYDEALRRLEDLDWGLRFGLSQGLLLSHPIAGVSIQPSNRTNFEAVKGTSEQILSKYSFLRSNEPKTYTSLSAYLALEQSTFAVHERKWFRAAYEIMRSFILFPRLRRHFSPGWTYEKYKATEPNGR